MNFPEYKRINKEFEVAVLVDNIEPATIASSIQQLINDGNLYAKLKENCKKARTVLNWQNEEKRLVEFYQKVLI
jgi:glycosyltransferase involved in cell wall biosynthesis